MFQDEASPMLRETIDAARKNDTPYLCWQKVWRMLAGGNHTAKSKYLNMDRVRDLPEQLRVCPGISRCFLRSCSKVQVREKKSSFIILFWPHFGQSILISCNQKLKMALCCCGPKRELFDYHWVPCTPDNERRRFWCRG